MNVGKIKLVSWVAVAGLGGLLGWEVYRFLTVVHPESRIPLSEDRQRAALEGAEVPAEEKREVVAYDDVLATFFSLNWSGYTPPERPVVDEPTGTLETPKDAVADLVTILLITYRTAKPEESSATVLYHYGPKKPTDQGVLRVGDSLRGKHAYVKVAAIEPDYVEFTFETGKGGEERQPERLGPPRFTVKGPPIEIVQVAPNGQPLEAPDRPLIPVLAQQQAYSPARTYEVRPRQYRIGTEDAAYVAENWSRLMVNEVQTRGYKDPRTGRYTGIQITSIKSGSVASAHGLRAGDIVKSINGQPVTSNQEAISYVKTNAESTTHWEVVVERQGRETTLTYEYQPEN